MNYAAWRTEDLEVLQRQLSEETGGQEELVPLEAEIDRRKRLEASSPRDLAERAVAFLESPTGTNLTQIEELVQALHYNDVSNQCQIRTRSPSEERQSTHM